MDGRISLLDMLRKVGVMSLALDTEGYATGDILSTLNNPILHFFLNKSLQTAEQSCHIEHLGPCAVWSSQSEGRVVDDQRPPLLC